MYIYLRSYPSYPRHNMVNQNNVYILFMLRQRFMILNFTSSSMHVAATTTSAEAGISYTCMAICKRTGPLVPFVINNIILYNRRNRFLIAHYSNNIQVVSLLKI